jgi:hypothetical protein
MPIDRRRFSTAGNLDIYRPERYHSDVLVERVEPLKISVDRSTAEPLWTYNWSRPTERSDKFRDPIDEYELRREAELKVKGRSNGPIPMSYYSTPLTYSVRTRPASPTPSVDVSRAKSTPRGTTTARQPTTNAGLALTESQNDIEEFERLMKRKFGYGGVNRYSTPLYTAPPYYSPYMYSSAYSSGTLPASHYSPYYYYSPYYRGAAGSTLDTLPDYYVSNTYTGPYVYSGQRSYDNLYSPPSRITAPGGYYVSYYDPIISGYDRYPVRYTSTSYVR